MKERSYKNEWQPVSTEPLFLEKVPKPKFTSVKAHDASREKVQIIVRTGKTYSHKEVPPGARIKGPCSTARCLVSVGAHVHRRHCTRFDDQQSG